MTVQFGTSATLAQAHAQLDISTLEVDFSGGTFKYTKKLVGGNQ